MKKVFIKLLSLLLVCLLTSSIVPISIFNANAEEYPSLLWPVKHNGYAITSKFGTRWLSGEWNDHKGIDIQASVGTNLYACLDGTVVVANKKRESTAGIYILIKHSKTLYYGFYHLSEYSVSVGDYVKQGQIIAKSGNTSKGNQTYGAHLHLIVFKRLEAGYARDAINTNISSGKNYKPNSTDYRTFEKGPLTYIQNDGNFLKVDPPTKPASPQVTLQTPANITVGDSIVFSWNTDSKVKSYSAILYKEGAKIEEKTPKTTKESFILPSDGTYTVKVTATNSVGSASTDSAPITAHKKPIVTFIEWDGQVHTQEVRYGGNALQPTVETRSGYYLKSWINDDDETQNLNNIIEDETFRAVYEPIKYIIKFVQVKNGETVVLDTQTVLYGNDAVPPENTGTPDEGYTFFGWNSEKYKNVSADATIEAVYQWANPDLPVETTITSALRQTDGYYVYFNLVNHAAQRTNGRAVVSVKTAQDKLICTTESAAFSIPANGTKNNMEVFVPSSSAATKIEVVIVDKFSSGVPISLRKTSAIDQGLMWSNWSTTYPTGASQIQERTEYRYRDKKKEVVNYTPRSGWTLYDTQKKYTDWIIPTDNDWTDSYAADTETKALYGTRQVQLTAGYTKYNYSRWQNSTVTHLHFCPVMGKNYYGGTWTQVYSGETTTYIAPTSLGQSHPSGCSCGRPGGSMVYYTFNGKKYYWNNPTTVAPTYKTQYRYKTRSIYYNYSYYQWPDWTDSWSGTAVTATDDRQVQTRTAYRSIGAANSTEDTSGVLRTVPGTVPVSFAGKQATIFIYKFDEPSDYTNEYVGQTVVEPNGSLACNFKLREEPSIKTGDMTIAVGLQGTTDIYILGTIVAPKPDYTVKFRDFDGTVLSTQTVAEGGNATLPANPSREGYTFLGWDTGIRNIRADMEINAIYAADEYSVVYIDWVNDTVQTVAYHNGDELIAPATDVKEGYDFVGWDAILSGTTTVTQNMIVTADYNPKTYTVTFLGFDNEVISTQTVAYQQPASVPEEPAEEGAEFCGWDEALDYTAVTQNITVKPVFFYDETVGVPEADVASGVYNANQSVTLSCATPGAQIYYTLDGSNPVEKGDLYTQPVAVTHSLELRFCAKAPDMNASEIQSCYYAINKANMTSAWLSFTDIPDHVIADPVPYNVFGQTGYRYKDTQTTHVLSEKAALLAAGWQEESVSQSAWSDWSLEQPATTGVDIEVESQDAPPIDTPHYRYEHWKYFDTVSQTTKVSRTVVAGMEGAWEYTPNLPNPLSVSGFEGTYPKYNYNAEIWYNQTVVIVPVTPDYDIYRYRYNEHTLFKWTPWSITAPVAGETRVTEEQFVYRYTEPVKYPVTIGGEMYEKETILATANQSVPIDAENLTGEGYTFLGYFTDPEFTQSWDIGSSVVTGSMTLYPKWVINTYDVVFKYDDGMVIDSQFVEYGAAAVPPVPEVREGYGFIGWDGGEYDYITGDLTLTAQYQLESEIVKVTLDKKIYSLVTGSSFKLTAALNPAGSEGSSVLWSSSETNVATVDESGLVTAMSAGTAVITATSSESGRTDTCALTVTPNPSSELALLIGSTYSVEAATGYLRGVKTGSNTVAAVAAQFYNANLQFISINGTALAAGDLVGTGTVIRFMNGDTVLDETTVALMGDMNGDGAINNRDAAMVTRYLVGKEAPNACQLAAIDVNADGTVNNRDASMVARYLVGKEVI